MRDRKGDREKDLRKQGEAGKGEGHQLTSSFNGKRLLFSVTITFGKRTLLDPSLFVHQCHSILGKALRLHLKPNDTICNLTIAEEDNKEQVAGLNS